MVEFRKISEFNRGTLYDILCDAYSFDERNRQIWDANWKENTLKSAYTGDYLYYEIRLD